MATISNLVPPSSKLDLGAFTSLQGLNARNSALASGPLAGLKNKVAISPLSTPPSNLPAGTQPGGLIGTKQYNSGINLGLISPSTPTSSSSAGALMPPPSGSLTGSLTQEQLDAQNKARGVSQFNTGPAQVGGAVGSQPVVQDSAPATGSRGLFPDVLSSLAYGTPARNAEIANKAEGIADTAGKQIADIGKAGAQAAGGYQTTGTTPVAEGNAAVIKQTTAAQQEAVAKGAEAQLTGTSQAFTGSGQTATALNSAGGLIPEALRYGSVPGANGTNSFDPNTAASKYAQEVSTGARGYDDAVSAMGLYGSAGKQFLDNAIRSINPNFNFAQAQALASTQGTVAPNLNMAQQALTNLQNTFAETPWYQKFGAPLLNSFTNMLAGFGIGTGSETSKQNAIKEARTNVSNALGTMTNTTPSAWTATVEGWFPDNATPDQVQSGIQQFATLAGYRQQLFGSPGNVQPYGSAGSGTAGATGGAGLFNW